MVGMSLFVRMAVLLSVLNGARLSVADEVDWPAFLHRNDMVWPALPTNWNNGAFIGNGRLGGIFWQEQAGELAVEVSRGDLYDHRRTSSDYSVLFARYRLPVGQLVLRFSDAGKKLDGDLRLDLWNAEARGIVRDGDCAWKLRAFASADQRVLVFDIESSADKPRVSFNPRPAKSTRDNRPPAGYAAYPPAKQKTIDGATVWVQDMPEDPATRTDGMGEGQFATAWRTVDLSPTRQLILLAIEHTHPGTKADQQAADRVREAERVGIEQIESAHRAWWHQYYPKSFLSVPDGSVESFYWIQMYKMGSLSRKGGPLIDLMGPWFLRTGWPAIWWNLNVQLTYWPFYMSNHLDEAEPLVDALWDHRDALAKNAAPHMDGSLAIGRSTAPDLRAAVGKEVGNLPWTMHNLWLHYRSTMDDAMLRDRLFPLMKGSFRYLTHIAIEQPDGRLALPPTASPEYTEGVADCAYTLSAFRWLARTIIEADRRLNADDPIVAECQDVLKRLVDYPIDEKTGVMVGKGLPFTESHRHWSHLFMIYPFHEWDWADPERRPLMEKSLENWTGLPEKFRGYSWLGAASMWAAAGEGDKAMGYLDVFLAKSTLANTLYREGFPVIETPLAGARTIQELLMASHGDRIRVFPALPSAWKDVAFADLRAEGAFLVTAKRVGGVTQFVTVTSLAGEPCRISTSLAGPVAAIEPNVKIRPLDGGVVEVELAKGQSATLYSTTAGRPNDLAAVPVPRAGDVPPWGAVRGIKPPSAAGR